MGYRNAGNGAVNIMTGSTTGFQQPSTFGSDYNAQRFVINTLLSLARTGTPCRVLSVTNSGGVSPVGKVNLQPLVNQVSGNGLSQPEGAINNIPYFRLQGGSDAVIIDPKVGDIGFAVFADSDTSSVIKNKAQSNPGSARQFDVSDGWFFPCFLGNTPTQYARFYDGGIEVVSSIAGGKVRLVDGAGSVIEMNGDGTGIMTFPGGLTINAPVTVNGNVSTTGTMSNNGTDIGSTHAHQVPLVQSGSSTIETTPPNI